MFNIRNSQLEDQLVQKISEDMALANVIHYALLARRILVAGKNEPYIAAYDIAQKETNKRIQMLKDEIDMLVFERKVSKELLTDTLAILSTHKRTKAINSSAGSSEGVRSPVSDGVRYK
ncbi:MAG: hypothetical protein V3U87_14935 [Methylococcaceae bacterium]